ncbi:hypothetical protein B0H16DRAFT_1861501 [Mycena metata]|uniref:Uncharacterized protein n=1 Tax=Mycena metata TaxID=1033252 RepID=A0AAD7N2Y0_9AGAR|nr:hypothetical protein B0H16DRAFT_1861501 [Mycena metata]
MPRVHIVSPRRQLTVLAEEVVVDEEEVAVEQEDDVRRRGQARHRVRVLLVLVRVSVKRRRGDWRRKDADTAAICAAYCGGYCTTVLGGRGTYSDDCCAGVERARRPVPNIHVHADVCIRRRPRMRTPSASRAVNRAHSLPPLPLALPVAFDVRREVVNVLVGVNIDNEREVLVEVDEDKGPAYETGAARERHRSNGVPILALKNAVERCTGEHVCECELGRAARVSRHARVSRGLPPEDDELADEYDADEVVVDATGMRVSPNLLRRRRRKREARNHMVRRRALSARLPALRPVDLLLGGYPFAACNAANGFCPSVHRVMGVDRHPLMLPLYTPTPRRAHAHPPPLLPSPPLPTFPPLTFSLLAPASTALSYRAKWRSGKKEDARAQDVRVGGLGRPGGACACSSKRRFSNCRRERKKEERKTKWKGVKQKWAPPRAQPCATSFESESKVGKGTRQMAPDSYIKHRMQEEIFWEEEEKAAAQEHNYRPTYRWARLRRINGKNATRATRGCRLHETGPCAVPQNADAQRAESRTRIVHKLVLDMQCIKGCPHPHPTSCASAKRAHAQSGESASHADRHSGRQSADARKPHNANPEFGAGLGGRAEVVQAQAVVAVQGEDDIRLADLQNKGGGKGRAGVKSQRKKDQRKKGEAPPPPARAGHRQHRRGANGWRRRRAFGGSIVTYTREEPFTPPPRAAARAKQTVEGQNGLQPEPKPRGNASARRRSRAAAAAAARLTQKGAAENGGASRRHPRTERRRDFAPKAAKALTSNNSSSRRTTRPTHGDQKQARIASGAKKKHAAHAWRGRQCAKQR